MCDEFDFSSFGILNEAAENGQVDYLYIQTLLDKEPPFSASEVRRSLRFAVNQWLSGELNVIEIKLVLYNESPAWGCVYKG